MSCRHLFLGSNACSICMWPLPLPYYPGPHADARDGDTEPPPPPAVRDACGNVGVEEDPCTDELGHTGLHSWQRAGGTVIVPCICCEALAEQPATGKILYCAKCGSAWAREPWRTADEVVAFIREILTEQQDASRRRFYNSTLVLFQIAQAIDAFPFKGAR